MCCLLVLNSVTSTLQQWIRRPIDEIQDRDLEIERLHRQVSEYQELLKECKQQLNEAKREIKEMPSCIREIRYQRVQDIVGTSTSTGTKNYNS